MTKRKVANWNAAWRLMIAVTAGLVWFSMNGERLVAQRVFGLDTSSAANTNVSQAQWNAAYSSGWPAAGIPSFQFAFVRSNHGINDPDDSQFYNNISRATTAGLLVGSYNFVEPNLNSATDRGEPLSRSGRHVYEARLPSAGARFGKRLQLFRSLC